MLDQCAFPTLPDRYATALREACAWICSTHEPIAIVASGSIIRGNPDLTSDLDIHVLHRQPWRQRVQRWSAEVPCEIFINPPERVREYFIDEQRRGRPSSAHMYATGVIVYDMEGEAARLRDEAHTWLQRPPTINEDGLIRLRYEAATVVEDTFDIAERDPVTAALLIGEAAQAILRYRHLACGRLIPRQKETLSSLAAIDPTLAPIASACYFGTVSERTQALGHLADICLGTRGFFTWESDRNS